MAPTLRNDQFDPLPAEKAERWETFLNWPDVTFFPNVVGLQLEEVKCDYARVRLPFRDELNQPAGIVHGGAIATVIDTVVVPAVAWIFDEFRPLLTIDMNVRYLEAVQGEDIIAEGWVRRRGSSIVFLDVDVWSGSGALCATGSLTYKIGRPMPAPDGVTR